MESTIRISRRAALGRIACLAPQAGIVVSTAITAIQAQAATKAAKQDFSYQDKPKQGKSCASCRMFLPTTNGVGNCAVVDGDISPNGWCMAYTARAD